MSKKSPFELLNPDSDSYIVKQKKETIDPKSITALLTPIHNFIQEAIEAHIKEANSLPSETHEKLLNKYTEFFNRFFFYVNEKCDPALKEQFRHAHQHLSTLKPESTALCDTSMAPPRQKTNDRSLYQILTGSPIEVTSTEGKKLIALYSRTIDLRDKSSSDSYLTNWLKFVEDKPLTEAELAQIRDARKNQQQLDTKQPDTKLKESYRQIELWLAQKPQQAHIRTKTPMTLLLRKLAPILAPMLAGFVISIGAVIAAGVMLNSFMASSATVFDAMINMYAADPVATISLCAALFVSIALTVIPFIVSKTKASQCGTFKANPHSASEPQAGSRLTTDAQ